MLIIIFFLLFTLLLFNIAQAENSVVERDKYARPKNKLPRKYT